MNKLSLLAVGTMFLALLVSAFSFAPPAGPSANGQGSLTVGTDQQRRFSFHANTMPDGSVQGSGVLTYTGGEYKIKFDINCLKVTGNTAIMSGNITSVSGPEAVNFPGYVEGTLVVFKVTDNGEGSNASSDQLSRLGAGSDCNSGIVLQTFPIEGGNIQVKP
ncbi:MAG: hypothetical protein H7296_06910 [Bacteroidia bacterium]|nr:hypothetical protein [Bacteroidia bacterium]